MAGRTLALRYGPPWSPVSRTEVPGSWPNWHLTSSGVGHHLIPSPPFPPPTVQVSLAERRGWGLRLTPAQRQGSTGGLREERETRVPGSGGAGEGS